MVPLVDEDEPDEEEVEVELTQRGVGVPVLEAEQFTFSEQEFEFASGQQIVPLSAVHRIQVPLKHFGTALFVQYGFPVALQKACPGATPDEELEVVELIQRGVGVPVFDEQSTSSEQEFELASGQQIVDPPPVHLIQVPLKHFGIALLVQDKLLFASQNA